VFREVLRLPEPQREATLLVYVEGLTYRETAEVLKVPVGTIMSRLAAARLKLSGINSEIPSKSRRGEEFPLDAMLVAYLDGELEPEPHEEVERLLKSDASVRERLAALARGTRPLKRSFDAVLEAAPRERLQAKLAASVPKVARRTWLARSRRWGMAIAAALLLLIGGGMAGYLLGQASPDLFEIGNSEEEAWLDAVANQVSLYNRESVASIPVDERAQEAELSRLGKALKLDLPQGWVALPGLMLKRADLLQFENRPLAQLLYEGEYGVVVLCIMLEPDGEPEREAERRAGLNTLYWASGDYRFLLVGSVSAETMESIADVIENRFAS
jgi:anti-sigma factor RsiW